MFDRSGETFQKCMHNLAEYLKGYPWYYIVEGPNKKEQRVVDVWVPWKGW